MGISEDFSAATTKDREFLSNILLAAEEELDGKFEYGFIKYKSLVIKDCSGTYHRFTADYVRANPDCLKKRLEGVQHS